MLVIWKMKWLLSLLSYWLLWLEQKSRFWILLNSVLHSFVAILWCNVLSDACGAHPEPYFASTIDSDSPCAIVDPSDVLWVRCVHAHPLSAIPASCKIWHHFLTTERSTIIVFGTSSPSSCLEWNVHKRHCKKWPECDMRGGCLVIGSDHCRIGIMSTTKFAITIRKRIAQLLYAFIGIFACQRCNILRGWVNIIVKNRNPALKILMHNHSTKLLGFRVLLFLVLLQPQLPHIQESLVVYYRRCVQALLCPSLECDGVEEVQSSKPSWHLMMHDCLFFEAVFTSCRTARISWSTPICPACTCFAAVSVWGCTNVLYAEIVALAPLRSRLFSGAINF